MIETQQWPVCAEALPRQHMSAVGGVDTPETACGGWDGDEFVVAYPRVAQVRDQGRGVRGH
jgi:hypothetical protein